MDFEIPCFPCAVATLLRSVHTYHLREGYIVDNVTERMGAVSIPSVKVAGIVGTMINFDGDGK